MEVNFFRARVLKFNSSSMKWHTLLLIKFSLLILRIKLKIVFKFFIPSINIFAF